MNSVAVYCMFLQLDCLLVLFLKKKKVNVRQIYLSFTFKESVCLNFITSGTFLFLFFSFVQNTLLVRRLAKSSWDHTSQKLSVFVYKMMLETKCFKLWSTLQPVSVCFPALASFWGLSLFLRGEEKRKKKGRLKHVHHNTEINLLFLQMISCIVRIYFRGGGEITPFLVVDVILKCFLVVVEYFLNVLWHVTQYSAVF